MLAIAVRVEDPIGFIDEQMRLFDVALEADPSESAAALLDRRVSELLEEAA